MIAVTAPTGRIGSALAPLLLSKGEKVRVIVGNPEKLAPQLRDRIEVVKGSTDDPEVVSATHARARNPCSS